MKKATLTIWKRSRERPMDLSLVGPYDKMLALIFGISFIVSAVIIILMSKFTEIEMGYIVVLLSAPFFVAGIFVYVQYKRWMYAVALIALDIVLFYFGISPIIIFILSFTFVGAAGVVGVVVIIQRMIFYRIVSIVEYINIKDELSFTDRIVAFLFSIPRDLDTRALTMNYNLKRASIPWNEMAQTISLGLMLGMFLWIYISMNPAFLDTGTMKTSLAEASAMMFSLILYIPLLVLPWSIFKSLNVRVETKYRDFSLYSGIKETLKRMAVPIFASFMFVLLAINQTGLDMVFAYIAVSVAFNILIIGLTSLFFYLMFEAPLVDDIVSKWKVFRPVEIMMDIGSDTKTDDVPGTPKRDISDHGKVEFPKTK